MKIQRVNDTTIKCIITEEDLRDSGLALHDLFDRKKEAMEFLRKVITRAIKSENFNLQGEYTSMHVKINSDQSVSLTLSHDPKEAGNIREICRDALEKLGKQEDQEDGNVFLFRFRTMQDVVRYCRELKASRGTHTELCRDHQNQYYLLLRQNKSEPVVFTAQSLMAEEFGELVTSDRAKALSIREHLDTVIGSDVIRVLNEL